MKRLASFTIMTIFTVALAAAAGSAAKDRETEPESVRVAALAGPSGVGMAYLFSNPPKLGSRTSVSFETAGSVDALLPKLLNGDIDIGILPPNVAAKLHALNPRSIVAGAVVGNGMLALITRDPSIRTLADLAGKTVSVAGQGSTPEYVFRALLAGSGIPADSVTLDFSIPNTEIAAALVSGKIQYAVVPEPFATVAVMNGTTGDRPVRRAILLRDVWKAKGFGSDFPMTLCVIRRDFAEKHPATVRAFLAAYRSSIDWTIENPAEAGKLVETAGLGLKAPIASKAIPACNFRFEPATEARGSIESLLSVFIGYAPASVGGTLPDDSFYFK